MNALYSLYDALVSINVPNEKARAVVDAMERDMSTLLATKADLATTQLLLKQNVDHVRDTLKQEIDNVRDSLKQEIDNVRDTLKQEICNVRDTLRQEIAASRAAMTITLGSIMVIGMGLLFAALKFT